MPIQWEKLALRIEELIRVGKSTLVIEQFEYLKKSKIPRELVEKFALLSYRGNVPDFGLRILNPYVRNEKKKSAEASPGEKCEYALGLIRAGAIDEAHELLDSIDSTHFPKAAYYKAFAFISRWGYAESIPLLERFLSLENIDLYDRAVAEANLAASYVYEKEAAKAEHLLNEIIQKARDNSFKLILGKSLHLKAENFLNLKQWEDFDDALEDATRLFHLASSRDKFFLKKLALQKDIELEPESLNVLERLKELKTEAIEMHHFESVRDCDRLLAMHTSNVNLFLQVYFGTPYPRYRERLVQEFQEKTDIPSSYDWQLGEKAGKQVLDLANSTYGNGETAFEIGSIPYKLLVALSADFYSPRRIAVLHHALYPGEYFNPVSSPARIYRAMRRLRDYLEENQLPLFISEDDGFFTLKASQPASIKVHSLQEDLSTVSKTVFELIKHYSDRTFTVAEASKELQIPVRTLSRQIKECVEEGKITRLGRGRDSRYAILTVKKAA